MFSSDQTFPFTVHNVRGQTGTEEPYLKGFSVGGNKKTTANSGVEEPTPSDFRQTLLK